MRTELIAYFKSLKLKNFGVTDELPFSNSATVMYLKNPKKIYTDLKQSTTEQVIAVLGNHGIFAEIHTVRVFFSTDAKNLPSDYETVVDQLRAGQDVTTATTYYRREVDTTTSFDGDLMITELEFRFTKLT
jgi:hypothetical protein